jgi:hypothetical protein
MWYSLICVPSKKQQADFLLVWDLYGAKQQKTAIKQNFFRGPSKN